MKIISFFVVLFLVAASYILFLDRTPIHLNQDELGFSLNAYSITKSGFDENGRFFPLYFWHLGVMWATPIIVYLTSLVLTALPLSETVIRLPSLFIGFANLVLIYFLGKQIFTNKFWALLCVIVLALTPVHFIHSRILLDVLYVVPFILLWLIFLLKFLEKDRPLFLLFSTLALGFGFYSYHAARVMMPFYFIVSFIFLFRKIIRNKKLILVLLLGFVLPLLPLIHWTSQYPDTLFLDQAKYTRIYDKEVSFLQGVSILLSPEGISHRLDVFISYFNPIFLFLLGDASLIHSTSFHHPLGLSQSVIRAGVFLLPFIVFLPLGIYQIVKKDKRLAFLLIFGFFTAPIAATIAGDHYRISRALFILPFATMLAVYGIRFLIANKMRAVRFSGYLLIFISLIQFTYFLYDYWTDYRIRSYAWMKYNIPGALEGVIAQEKTNLSNKIYIDRRTEFIDWYWRFYLIKHQSEELADKTIFFEPRDVVLEDLEQNSILLFNHNDVDGLKSEVGPFKKVSNIFEPDGVSTFYIYRN